jgi:predicted NAD/FAD-dependent oxidoreductase
MTPDVIMIGAGMTGLTCARYLADAGVSVQVLDKGRGVGGRMATRRAAADGLELRFDHGAQFLNVKDPDLAYLFQRFPAAVGDWADQTGQDRKVGSAGMSSLPRAMAESLQVAQGVEVTRIHRAGDVWCVAAGDTLFTAAHLVMTVPAPQAVHLLAKDPLAKDLADVEMAPSLVLMAAFPPGSPQPFVSRADDTADLAWIAQDGTKPGRSTDAVTWVAQASMAWSLAHLELDKDAIAEAMLPLLCTAIGADADDVVHLAAHRWRYAQATRPLGQPFLRHPSLPLHIGGDWCLGPKVEHAVASGKSIARDYLEMRDVG